MSNGRLEGVNRVEVIDGDGRAYVLKRDYLDVRWSLQDEGRTLKVFIIGASRDHEQGCPALGGYGTSDRACVCAASSRLK